MESLVDEFLRHLRIERGLADNTVIAYGRDLVEFSDFLARSGGVSIECVQQNQIRDFDSSLLAGGLKTSSRARKISTVKSFYKFLFVEGKIAANPASTIRAPKTTLRLPKALSQDRVSHLLEAAGPMPDEHWLSSAAARNRTILELMYATGARVSELVDLDLDDVFESDFVRLLGKGNKERVVPLGSFARRALDAYIVRARPDFIGKTGTSALFLNHHGNRLSRQSAWQIIRAAGDIIGESVSPHTLRHSFATHLLEGGADVRVVQELLGHASVATTQIYTLVTLENLRAVYSLAHPRAQG